MEEGQETFNNWSPGNNYYVDGKYIGKLTYGLAMPYKTEKNNYDKNSQILLNSPSIKIIIATVWLFRIITPNNKQC